MGELLEGDGPDHPAFIGDRLVLRKSRENGRERHTATNADHALLIERPVGGWRPAVALIGVLAIFASCLAVGAVLRDLIGQNPLGMVVFVLSILAAPVASLFVMAHIMPRQHVSIRSQESGALLLQVLDDERISLLSSPFTVTDANGNAIGRLRRRSGIATTRWDCIDNNQRLAWRIAGVSRAKAVGRRFIESLLHNPAVTQSMRVSYELTTPEHQTLGRITRNDAGPGVTTLDLTADSGFTIDRRLALAAAIKINLAIQT